MIHNTVNTLRTKIHSVTSGMAVPLTCQSCGLACHQRLILPLVKERDEREIRDTDEKDERKRDERDSGERDRGEIDKG